MCRAISPNSPEFESRVARANALVRNSQFQEARTALLKLRDELAMTTGESDALVIDFDVSIFDLLTTCDLTADAAELSTPLFGVRNNCRK